MSDDAEPEPPSAAPWILGGVAAVGVVAAVVLGILWLQAADERDDAQAELEVTEAQLAEAEVALAAAEDEIARLEETLDREGTVDELVEQSDGAISRAQATCLVDGWIAELGEERALELNTSDPTADEQHAISEITMECLS